MEQLSKPKLLVTILNQGWIRPELANIQHLLLSDMRAEVSVSHINIRPSENARNQSVKMMLDGGFDYLLTIDHDTVPLRNPIDLLFFNLDVVGFAYLGMQTNEQGIELAFMGMDKQENGEYLDHKETKGLQAVDAVGSGCLLMSRKVLEQVKAPFVRKWNEDGFAITGLDFYFCEKAKELEFQPYCHYDYVADHYKDISLLNVLKFSYDK